METFISKSQIMMNKITPYIDLNYWLKVWTLIVVWNLSMKINLLKVPKVIELTMR